MSNCRSCQHAVNTHRCDRLMFGSTKVRADIGDWGMTVKWEWADGGGLPSLDSPTCPYYTLKPVTLNDLINEAHRTAVLKGWWGDAAADALVTGNPVDAYEDRNLYEQVALMHSELSEAVEELRNGRGVTEVYYNEGKPGKPEGFPIELADVLIRIFDTAGRYGIDLPAAIDMKLKYNQSRPYRHGGKKA